MGYGSEGKGYGEGKGKKGKGDKGGKGGKGGKEGGKQWRPKKGDDEKGEGKGKKGGKKGGKSVCEENQTTKVDLEQEIDGKTEKRYFILHTRKDIAPDAKLPVVIAFHGASGSPNMYSSELDSLVKDGHFVGVYPAGFNRFWNLGPEPTNADDIEFVEKVIAELENAEKYPYIDHSQRFCLGNSNGAGLAHKLACERELFRAYACMVTSLHVGQKPQKGLVRLIQIMGMEDNLVPYKGGGSQVLDPKDEFMPAEDSARAWATHDGCNAEETVTVSSSSGSRKLEWSNDSDPYKKIMHVGVAGGGHMLPRDYVDEELGFTDGLYAFILKFYKGD